MGQWQNAPRRAAAERNIAGLMSGASASALAMAVGVLAAPQTASAQAAGEVQEVVVAASRVNRLGYGAPTPTTVVGVDQLQLSGAPTLSIALTQLPVFLTSATPARGDPE